MTLPESVQVRHSVHCIKQFSKTTRNILFVSVVKKGVSLRETASYEPSCVKIGSDVFAVGDDKKKERKWKEKGKEW